MWHRKLAHARTWVLYACACVWLSCIWMISMGWCRTKPSSSSSSLFVFSTHVQTNNRTNWISVVVTVAVAVVILCAVWATLWYCTLGLPFLPCRCHHGAHGSIISKTWRVRARVKRILPGGFVELARAHERFCVNCGGYKFPYILYNTHVYYVQIVCEWIVTIYHIQILGVNDRANRFLFGVLRTRSGCCLFFCADSVVFRFRIVFFFWRRWVLCVFYATTRVHWNVGSMLERNDRMVKWLGGVESVPIFIFRVSCSIYNIIFTWIPFALNYYFDTISFHLLIGMQKMQIICVYDSLFNGQIINSVPFFVLCLFVFPLQVSVAPKLRRSISDDDAADETDSPKLWRRSCMFLFSMGVCFYLVFSSDYYHSIYWSSWINFMGTVLTQV